MVHDLLTHGANPNFADAAGGTALSKAAYEGDEAMVRDLVGHDADPRIPWKEGTTALDCAKTPAIKAILMRKAP